MKGRNYVNPIRTSVKLILMVAVWLFSVSWFGVIPVHAAPPSNDNFDNATIISGVPYQASLSTLEATPQDNEPLIDPQITALCDGHTLESGLATVWYRFTSSTTRSVSMDTMGSNYDTYIAVWTGPDVNNLTLVTCDDDSLGRQQSQVTFTATAGVTYHILVAQYNGEINVGSTSLKNGTDFGAQAGGDLQFHVTTFEDVPGDHSAWTWIERLYAAGITSGCSTNPMNYCPSMAVTRAQMAIFLERGIRGSTYTPPPAQGTIFADVSVSTPGAPWIEQLYADGITGGCATNPLRYCPTNTVTRAQMAVFLLRSKHGAGYTPPPATGTVFNDVTTSTPAAAWIEQLYAEGITTGCGGGNYCPASSVTRAQMAIFLVRTFNLP
ncbi:MAG TPA: S-layer homology domain-containing protein [Anaerolineales bacterium]|nr:S-layer homology domain-containing protein [Anaerolineales bacterium]